MAGQSNQEIRLDLLTRALDSLSDPVRALELAREMEAFVLYGSSSARERKAPASGGADAAGCADATGSKADLVPARPVRKTGKKPRWTPANDDTLRDHWQNGVSLFDMARSLGRSEVSIIARARRLGLPQRGETKSVAARRRPRSGETGNGSESTAEADPAAETVTIPCDDRLTQGFHPGRSTAPSDLPPKSSQNCVTVHLCPVTAHTMETVITFMRSRDYSVVRDGAGSFLVDGHTKLTAQELISRANRLRECLGKPGFELDSVLDLVD